MTCPWCHSKVGQESVLGVLGFLKWFRCRYCGGEFSRQTRRRS